MRFILDEIRYYHEISTEFFIEFLNSRRNYEENRKIEFNQFLDRYLFNINIFQYLNFCFYEIDRSNDDIESINDHLDISSLIFLRIISFQKIIHQFL